MDDVLIDAPYDISQDMINSLDISVVVHGRVRPQAEEDGATDPYALPRKLKMVKVVDSESNLTVFDIEDRIFRQRERFEAKFAKKKAAEDEYYANKYNKEAEATEEDEEEEVVVKPKKRVTKKTKAAEPAPEVVVTEGRPKRNAAKKRY